MTAAVSNIILGPVVVWYAPVATTLPSADTIAYGTAWGGNWVQVGYTKAPLSFLYDAKDEDIEIEEALAPVRRHRISEDLSLETTLAELIATNLQLATGETPSVTAPGAGVVGKEEITGGGRAELAEKTWGFEGLYTDSSGTDFPVRVFVYKGTARLGGKLEFGKKGYPGIVLQVRALADLTQSVGSQLFKFQRVTAAAT